MADPLDRWPEFVEVVRTRLEAGRAAYGDRSFAAEPAALVTEVQAELADVCGWAFVLWHRLESLRARVAEESSPPAAEPGLNEEAPRRAP